VRTRRIKPWAWRDHTDPFSTLNVPGGPARFVVEQVSDKEFCIPDGLGFQYNRDGHAPISVTPATLPTTDFASIPRYMSWFVSRHGRHTPAALVHDQLVVDDMAFEDRKEADRLFLEMMDDLEVPPVQSRVMWTAVTLATRLHGPLAAKVALGAWAVVAAVGIALLGWGLVTITPWMVLASLAGPALAAPLWGGQARAGLIAGYALPVVALPALASLLGYWAYWVVEKAVKVIRQRRPAHAGEPLPEPIGYQGR
jgi:hypothetical protein